MTTNCLRTGLFLLAAWCSLISMVNRCAHATTDPSPIACAAPLYHAFDFWIGDWDVFEVGNPMKVAHARIDSILNGCVLREDYRASDGHEGQSFTIYDSTRDVWHQTWVTSQGELLEIEGKSENGQIVLSGKNQKGEMVRGTWKPVSGEVHEVAVKSGDGGRTWQPWFDLGFRSHEAEGTAARPHDNEENEKQIVAGLDAQYQEAVKQNDAATMDRILADDFILVTSSGKTFRKSDLLDEAKNQRRIYEHQEDTDKTVRMWGDTAIVTANLWEKGTEDGKPFEHKLWFSDVYRRTPKGWQYIFAQSAYRPMALP